MLPRMPVILDLAVFAVVYQLIDDGIDFETHPDRAVPDFDAFHSVEIANEASLQ